MDARLVEIAGDDYREELITHFQSLYHGEEDKPHGGEPVTRLWSNSHSPR